MLILVVRKIPPGFKGLNQIRFGKATKCYFAFYSAGDAGEKGNFD